mgnify:CR=1 FL=1|jgi:hypothetical protein
MKTKGDESRTRACDAIWIAGEALMCEPVGVSLENKYTNTKNLQK